ncbi:hypothetical protein N7462_010784 [Penicillium macrosclerotiorum]|uniref:uncharacterized protein n=1 Tax=Penicillium macrosclerotiorum TaxID=303699 RepID=UPI0025472653|nr:uncharacterized protein N7462_010784 [Penicillium macrosclerotiorum]KAJ5669714.1 hypothetical protein N7462_010784 [Penicillium macrosclerotiorum]
MTRQSPARPTRGRAAHGRQLKRQVLQEDRIPEVYQEMLEEAEARDPEQFHLERPIKRRKVGETRGINTKAIPVDPSSLVQDNSVTTNADATENVQTIYDSTVSEESDVEWEDVNIMQPAAGPASSTLATQGNEETLQITLDQKPEKTKKTMQRRKPVTVAEKNLRLDIHKAHLLCLLAHVNLRNRWCNDDKLQRFLKQMLHKRVVALLNPDETKPQFTRSTTFIDGLNQAGDIFNRRFQVTKPGLKRAHWAEDQTQLRQRIQSIMSDAEVFLSKEDFLSQAKIMQGSRDFGAMLFCSLLRAVAVEARLVCSLQTLPFSGTVKDMTPSKMAPQYIVVSSDDHETSTDERRKASGAPLTPTRKRRIGRPQFTTRPAQASVRLGSLPTLRESSYPAFWVEAFNEAVQKWVPIDPLVTKSLAKPSKFEPPASDPYNSMAYVVAFEDDASARDVTRRYAKAFNAKTRKSRVETTRNGEEWWNKALNVYEKPFLDDRDEAEISELTSKSAAEPMPRNIQDFKDHPVYALDRHLRRNEVIFPKRVIGHVGLSKSTSKSDNLDPVYRRSDVHVVRSADKWYRLGRDVKVGEQPLKHVPAARPKSGFASDDDEAEPEHTALYAEYQTEIYQPPPVVQGRIPKNGYGNLDIYVPSMVPPGAVHIKRPDASRAARILGIDYADAVTGFDFKGRRGTAIFGGIVIALEYQEALEEVLQGIANDKQQAALEARTAETLRLWRLFLVKLRIAERVKAYADEDEEMGDATNTEMMNDPLEEFEGGGFFPDSNQLSQSSRSEIRERQQTETGGEDDFGGGFIAEEGVPILKEGNGLAYEENTKETFVPGDGGGFVPEEEVIANDATDQGISLTQTSTSTSNRPLKKWKDHNKPRYELVVVPKESSSMTKEQPTDMQHAISELEGSSEKAPITIDSSNNGGSKTTSVGIVSRPPSPQQVSQNVPIVVSDSDSDLEKGSLLSEDPEDKDAIPEWLM